MAPSLLDEPALVSCRIEFQTLFIGVLQFTVIITFSKKLILCTNSRVWLSKVILCSPVYKQWEKSV